MKHGFVAALAGIAAFSLASCASEASKPSTQQVVNAACSALPVVDLSFRVFGAQIGVTTEQMAWENGIVKVATAACANKSQGWEKVVEATVMAISEFLTNNGVKPSLGP